MKTNFLKAFAIFALFAASSCSNDDTNPNNPSVNGLKPTKIVEADANGTEQNVLTFTYNGNKLTEVANSAKIDGVASIKYYYTGDQVTKYETVRPSWGTEASEIEYNTSGKISKITHKNKSGDVNSTSVYTYNSNGTVTVATSYPTNPQWAGTATLTYNGNNVTIFEQTFNSSTTTKEFTYDTNNYNYLKNVAGMDAVRVMGYVHHFYMFPGTNFVTEYKITSNGTTSTNTYTGTFNSDKLPTKVTQQDGRTFTITY